MPLALVVGGGLSARQDAMNSWRRGFIKCRIRDGPIGSHQELARAEKWDNSSAETEDVEWLRLREGRDEERRGRVCRHVAGLAIAIEAIRIPRKESVDDMIFVEVFFFWSNKTKVRRARTWTAGLKLSIAQEKVRRCELNDSIVQCFGRDRCQVVFE